MRKEGGVTRIATRTEPVHDECCMSVRRLAGIGVFRIDIEHCGVCGGTLRVIACSETPELIEKILTHLAARNTGAINHPRAPPLHAPQAQPPASPSPALS